MLGLYTYANILSSNLKLGFLKAFFLAMALFLPFFNMRHKDSIAAPPKYAYSLAYSALSFLPDLSAGFLGLPDPVCSLINIQSLHRAAGFILKVNYTHLNFIWVTSWWICKYNHKSNITEPWPSIWKSNKIHEGCWNFCYYDYIRVKRAHQGST